MVPSLILGFVLLSFGLILNYSPVSRNMFFGYRTNRSMKNDNNWAFANKMFAGHALVIGCIGTLVALSNSFFSLFNARFTIFGILGLVFISIIRIEIRLRAFDKNQSDQ
jgi:uncharacterized membrane protein